MYNNVQDFVAQVRLVSRGPGADTTVLVPMSVISTEWDWSSCIPAHGTERYVQALQLLGIDLADAVPNKIRRGAITHLDVEPTSPLLIGYFAKTPTKERLLNLVAELKIFFREFQYYPKITDFDVYV